MMQSDKESWGRVAEASLMPSASHYAREMGCSNAAAATTCMWPPKVVFVRGCKHMRQPIRQLPAYGRRPRGIYVSSHDRHSLRASIDNKVV